MAATEITVQSIVRSGLDPTLESANVDGNYWSNNGRMYLEIDNGDTGSHTVTIDTPDAVDGLAIADRTVDVPAGERRKIGPFQKSVYNSPSGVVNISYDAVTSVTVGVFRL